MNAHARYILNVTPARGRDVLDAMSKTGWKAEIMGRDKGEGEFIVLVDVPAIEESMAIIRFNALQGDGTVNSFQRTSHWKFT